MTISSRLYGFVTGTFRGLALLRGSARLASWWVACLALIMGSAPLEAWQVTLPLERYENLRDRAFPQPQPPPQLPNLVAFEEARLTIEVGDQSARVIQELTISLLDGDWHEIQLASSGTFVAADFSSAEGYLKAGEGWRLRLRGLGRHTITVESAVSLVEDSAASRRTARLDLELPAAALVSGTLVAPSWVQDAEISEVDDKALPATSSGVLTAVAIPSAPSGSKTWSFLGHPGGHHQLVFLGHSLAPDRQRLPLRFEALSATVIRMGRTLGEAEGWIRVKVLQGQLDRLLVEVPSFLEVIAVEGKAVAGWQREGTSLEVTPLEDDPQELTFQVEMTGPAMVDFASPVLVPLGAASAKLYSKVSALGGGFLQWVDPGDSWVETEKIGDLPLGFIEAEGLTLGWSVGERRPTWKLAWSEGVEVLAAQIDRALVDVVVGASGEAFYQLWIEVRSRGVTTLEVTLPAEFSLATSYRDGRVVSLGAVNSQQEVLVFPLSAVAGRQVLFLSGRLPLELPAGAGQLVVPVPAFSVPVAAVQARVALPASRQARLEEGSRGGSVEKPPVVAASSSTTPLARLLGAAGSNSLSTKNPNLLIPPVGFRVIEAAWSALTAAPSPVVLELLRPSRESRWF
ncbi:MAG: hypothetical protein K0U98_17830 [Deltaproteobacteria bacterium]|nr:hypothetical protein [Deltaproteobacteria bacterium]